MKKVFSLLVVCLALTSCATTEKYEENLDKWKGQTEQHLYEKWGIPTKSMDVPNGKLVEYLHVNGSTSTVSTNQFTGTSVNTSSSWCKATFTIADGIVKSWRHEGNACRAD